MLKLLKRRLKNKNTLAREAISSGELLYLEGEELNDFVALSSRDNAVIKRINMLVSSADKRKEEGLFVIEGLRLCADAFENNARIKRLIVTKSAYEKYEKEIVKFAQKSEFCNIIPDSLAAKISDTKTPQGVFMAVYRPDSNAPFNKDKRYIALENLQDPSNLGAISRTAEALGFGGIILSAGCCDPFSPKALRASMGTLIRLSLVFAKDIATFCTDNGLNPVACVVDDSATDIKQFDFSPYDVLLIGNEANGLSDETKSKCRDKVTVRMLGKVESLNAAAAAAIAMWEQIR